MSNIQVKGHVVSKVIVMTQRDRHTPDRLVYLYH